MTGRRLTRFVRQVAAVARQNQVSVAAAGLAYHAFNTLVALVVLLLAGITAVDAFGAVLDLAEVVAGLDTGALDGIEEAVDHGGGRLGAVTLALAIFAWSAVRLFQSVNSAFTGIYGARKRQSLLRPVLTLALIVGTVAGGVSLVALLAVGMAQVVDGLGWRLLGPILLFASLLVGFLPMYYYAPGADVTAREVLPGAALAALSWTVLGVGFRAYVSASETVVIFGLAGAVLLALTWAYLGGAALLLGAACNAVLADRVEADDEWIPEPLRAVSRGAERANE